TERVLALADDARVPLLERVRFLAIGGANVDEFFMVRVSGLARAAHEVAEERAEDGRTAREQLETIRARVVALHDRQSSSVARALSELATSGIRLREWHELTTQQQDALRTLLKDHIETRLVTSGITLAPGHPFPRVPHLTLCLAVVGRDRRTDTWHL